MDKVPQRWITPFQGPDAATSPDTPAAAAAAAAAGPAQGLPAQAMSSALSLQGLSQLPVPADGRSRCACGLMALAVQPVASSHGRLACRMHFKEPTSRGARRQLMPVAPDTRRCAEVCQPEQALDTGLGGAVLAACKPCSPAWLRHR